VNVNQQGAWTFALGFVEIESRKLVLVILHIGESGFRTDGLFLVGRPTVWRKCKKQDKGETVSGELHGWGYHGATGEVASLMVKLATEYAPRFRSHWTAAIASGCRSPAS
jgi:hypothetical protein